jgi:hypothetical protein
MHLILKIEDDHATFFLKKFLGFHLIYGLECEVPLHVSSLEYDLYLPFKIISSNILHPAQGLSSLSTT